MSSYSSLSLASSLQLSSLRATSSILSSSDGFFYRPGVVGESVLGMGDVLNRLMEVEAQLVEEGIRDPHWMEVRYFSFPFHHFTDLLTEY
jgi:hypothetical protein